MVLKLADFNISINNNYSLIERFTKRYHTQAGAVDFELEITEKEIEFEKSQITVCFTPGYLEHISAYRKIAEWLPLHNAFLLHSATFDVGGVGVAFAAHSGTGKTTHMNLWQQYLGDKMVVVNGDKPIIRFFDEEEPDLPPSDEGGGPLAVEEEKNYPSASCLGTSPDKGRQGESKPIKKSVPYAYGTPWNGKEHLGCNMRTKLKHICFIERAKENSVEKMAKNEIIDLIFNQVYMPKDPLAAANTLILIDRLISCCDLWKIKCNMEPQAAEIAYKAIFNE